ncbi:YfjI family protein [Loktanella sp. Alg231-35]|uniref:YfjI family protein n=1 Tax=Loktanella sp. Alg231-35 TaxID=1922220 RepID=UPI000D5512F9|nr:YfjI family protein [Loktanella sp. Alg231-35]
MTRDEFDIVFGPWSDWLRDAAEVKGAPVDFVALNLLSSASAIVGNARWAVPWEGWKEPPIIWGMLIGDPSSGKSPALDAILDPIKAIDNELSAEYKTARKVWNEKDELAKLVLAQWKIDAKAAIKEGNEQPAKPSGADAGAPPIRGRIRITDTTTEKAADLIRDSWRGLLLSRDELSGWLGSMDRYSGGGDRPFWLEAYGGRSFTVDRKNSPEPIIVDHLSIAILGGTQPDKLDSLLLHSDDDGLLARFLTVFPAPMPLKRPTVTLGTEKAQQALERLRKLEPITDDKGERRPYFLHFQEPAQQALQEFRQQCRDWEGEVSGLMKSHIGKLPGLAVRVATVLALLDCAIMNGEPVNSISAAHLGRACHYVGEHMRRHAHRAYGAASMPAEVKAASRIAEIIQSEGLRQISTREIQRRGLVGLQSAKEIAPAFAVLQGASWIDTIAQSGPGRPAKIFAVNPHLENMR